MLLCYFTNERILQSYKRKVTKPLTHSAICVNDFTGTSDELHRLSLVISWLVISGARFISIFDQSKTLSGDKQLLARIVKRRLEVAYQNSKSSKVDILQFKEETDFIKFGVNADLQTEDKEITIMFLNSDYNTKDLLRACKQRGEEMNKLKP